MARATETEFCHVKKEQKKRQAYGFYTSGYMRLELLTEYL